MRHRRGDFTVETDLGVIVLLVGYASVVLTPVLLALVLWRVW